MNPIINALFICEASSEGHAVLTGPDGTVAVNGPHADQFIAGEQYEVIVSYIGDKPPHP